MLNLQKGENGKAANAAPQTFFQQYIPVPNKFNPNEITMVPLPGTGIPMRDYFAAKAMQGLVADLDYINPDHMTNAGAIARDAYAMADAMLAARQEKQPENNSQFHEDYQGNGK